MGPDGTARRFFPSRKKVACVAASVDSGPDRGQDRDIDPSRPLSVGTAQDNGFALSDPAVSRYHVELALDDGGVLVRDVGSLNGTYVGSVRVREAVVPVETRLRVGDSVLALLPRGERDALDLPAPAIPGIVAASAAMQEVARSIVALADKQTSVLIEGETGTGKELVAHALHRLGPAPEAPFEVVDCASISPTLITSELFGHARGAFTGADSIHVGAFERAQGGTVFLDEIGELPLEVQPVLLGVLQRRRFKPVGSSREVPVAVRVVAATNRDLRAEVNRGSFRADLYFRLAVARIVIPPLRERPEDIALLVGHFTAEFTGASEPAPFDDATMAALAQQHWAGNVRELQNAVESAIALGAFKLGPSRDSEQVPAAGDGDEPAASGAKYRVARREALDRFEKAYLKELLSRTNGNASLASREAGMDRTYLLSLLRRHGLR